MALYFHNLPFCVSVGKHSENSAKLDKKLAVKALPPDQRNDYCKLSFYTISAATLSQGWPMDSGPTDAQ